MGLQSDDGGPSNSGPNPTGPPQPNGPNQVGPPRPIRMTQNPTLGPKPGTNLPVRPQQVQGPGSSINMPSPNQNQMGPGSNTNPTSTVSCFATIF